VLFGNANAEKIVLLIFILLPLEEERKTYHGMSRQLDMSAKLKYKISKHANSAQNSETKVDGPTRRLLMRKIPLSLP
jgi:hypothetical protein